MTAPIEWISRSSVDVGGRLYDLCEFELDGVSFELSELAIRRSTPERFSLQKSLTMLERYLSLTEQLPARRIVELGVFQGGSSAFFGLLPWTECVAAFEYDDRTGEALDQMIAAKGLGDVIHTNYGVDQADRQAVLAALDAAGLDEVDLVIDDASHRYAESVASFDALFPRLRPGGIYVLEDWRWAHVRDVGLGADLDPATKPSLTRMVFELVMASGTHPDLIDEITVEPAMVLIRRGTASCDRETFHLGNHYDEISASLLGGPTPEPLPG